MIALRVSPRILALHVLTGVAWALALLYCRRTFFDDPPSFFFEPVLEGGLRLSQASRAREIEVAAYLKVASAIGTKASRPGRKKWPKRVCLGVLSDAKKRKHDEASMMRTLASLTSGLTADDRDSLHITVLLAAREPKSHFAFKKPWLSKLVDEVLVYRESDHNGTDSGTAGGEGVYREVEFDVNLGSPPRTKSSVERSRLDNSVLIEACRATQASYMALVEPDFVATRDWYPRLVTALPYVDHATRDMGDDWVYVSLFYYPESEWVWKTGEWLSYSTACSVVYAAVVVSCVGLYRWGFHRKGASAKALWQDSVPLLSLGLWIPVFMRLFVLAGGMDAIQHHYTPYVGGVREMMQGRCCGHGVVLPQRHLEEFQSIFRSPPYDSPVSAILDTLADERGLSKWGMDPSVTL